MLVLKKQGMYPISAQRAKEFLLPRHYSGRIPTISYSFGWFLDYKLVAVCTFGKPASHDVCKSICGSDHANKVYELSRLCREEDLTEPLSKFVGWCLRQLKKENLIIISYSDTAMDHHGYIYQSCNFIYTGLSNKQLDPYNSNQNKHNRHKRLKNTSKKIVRSPKHRYIYFAMNKREKKKMVKLFEYGEYLYPKGENKNYILGTILKPTII